VAFITDKEELKPGLILFRRTDVAHDNWYCRVKLPKQDRYKIVSLKTRDRNAAREAAFKEDYRVQFSLEKNLPIFNRSFAEVGQEYAKLQKQQASAGQISERRAAAVRGIIEGHLRRYVGQAQIQLVGHDLWNNYPAWRRSVGQGRLARSGNTRALTAEEKAGLEAEAEEKAKAKAARSAWRRKGKGAPVPEVEPKTPTEWIFVSDDTIRHEMVVFKAVLDYAASKRYIPADHRFGQLPKFRKNRRDEFTLEEYRRLHTKGRAWIKKTGKSFSTEQRTVVYNFILIMCSTGMRPPEAKNLRWRDITTAVDREQRKLVVLHVRGKGKERKLVAPEKVGEYLERVKALSKATAPSDPVFTNRDGSQAESLYQALIDDLLDYAGVRIGPSGAPRSTYSFRHTYATFRLSEGVDAYLLAEQMGTSVQMIQQHYGHVNTIKHANLVLHGMANWEPVTVSGRQAEEKSKPARIAAARSNLSTTNEKGRGRSRVTA
jgi:integrase